MLNNTHIYLSERIRQDNFNYKYREKVYEEHGTYLADMWLKEKAKEIDLWGFDWWGEEFVNAFLQRVMDVEGSIKEVDEIQWYFFCETANFGPPCYFLNKIWIKNFLSKEKIDAYGEKEPKPVMTQEESDRLSLQALADGMFDFYDVDCKEFNKILDEIEVDENNQIKNAEYITDRIAGLKKKN